MPDDEKLFKKLREKCWIGTRRLLNSLKQDGMHTQSDLSAYDQFDIASVV
jgi:hypothetical protein